MEVRIRPACGHDAAAINSIHRYYVENTVITFTYEPYTDAEILAKINNTYEENLPFVVAVEPSEEVLGYMSASGFRASKKGYWHCIEISLFCHPKHRGEGVGSALMNKFLFILREPQNHAAFIPNPERFRTVRQVIAGMAVDVDGPRQGIALKEFYQRFGFRETANMPKLGFKFNKWIDVLFMQLSLW